MKTTTGAEAAGRGLTRVVVNGAGLSAPLSIVGDPALLRLPLVGLFCSARLPPSGALAAYDLARALRDGGVAVASGFQSTGERECLEFLLRGRQPVVICPARGLGGMRIPIEWQRELEAGRLALASALPDRTRRPTTALAAGRNRLVVALSRAVIVLHATPGGRLARTVTEALSAGKRVYCLDLPENEDLRVAGAIPHGAAELAARVREGQ